MRPGPSLAGNGFFQLSQGPLQKMLPAHVEPSWSRIWDEPLVLGSRELGTTAGPQGACGAVLFRGLFGESVRDCFSLSHSASDRGRRVYPAAPLWCLGLFSHTDSADGFRLAHN